MPAMLRHKPTGDLYIFTDILSRRPDMEEVDAVVEKAAAPKPKPAPRKKAAAKKAAPAPKAEAAPAPKAEDDDPSSTGLAADLFGE